MPYLDSLELQIKAKADSAVTALDKLSARLGTISETLAKLEGGSLQGLAEGVDALSYAMQSYKNVDKSMFNSLATGLNKIASVDAGKVHTQTMAIQSLIEQLQNLQFATSNDSGIAKLTELTKALRGLGSKTIEQAATNIPKVADALEVMINKLAALPAVGNNTVEALNAVSAAANSMKSMGKTYTSNVNKMTQANVNTKRSFVSLASSMGLFWAEFGYVIKFFKQIWSIAERAMDYVETYNYFNVISSKIEKEYGEFGETAGENYVNGFRSEMTKLTEIMTGYSVGSNGELLNKGSIGLGIDPNTLLSFQTKIASITNSVGLLGEQSITASNSLSMLAVDLSSLTNQDISQVMENLSSGLIGQSRALYKYGIDITDATLEQYALANGVEKSVSEMSQSEKMQLRLLAILDQSKVAWGDQINTLDSVANQYRILKNQFTNLGRTVGNLFLPIIQKTLPYINGMVIAINNLMNVLGTALWGDSWLKDLNDGVSNGYNDTGLEDLGNSADGAADSMERLNSSIRGFDELNVIDSGSTKSSSDTVSDTLDLTSQMNDYLKAYESNWSQAFTQISNQAEKLGEIFTEKLNLDNAAKSIGGFVKAIGELVAAAAPLGEGFAEGFTYFIDHFAFEPLKLITDGINDLAKALGITDEDALLKVGEFIGMFAGAIVTIGTVSKALDIIKSVSSLIGTKMVAGMGPLGALASVLLAVGGMVDMFVSDKATKNAMDFLGTLGDMGGLVSALDDYYATVKDMQSLGKDSDLLLIFREWDKLNSNFASLDEHDKQMLKEYAEQLKQLLPEIANYIDEEGKAYEGVYNNLKQVIELEEKRAKLKAAEDIKTDLYKKEVGLRVQVANSESDVNKIIDKIQETFKHLSDTEITDLLKQYYNEGWSVNKLASKLDTANTLNTPGGQATSAFTLPFSKSAFTSGLEPLLGYGKVYYEALDSLEQLPEQYSNLEKVISELNNSVKSDTNTLEIKDIVKNAELYGISVSNLDTLETPVRKGVVQGMKENAYDDSEVIKVLKEISAKETASNVTVTLEGNMSNLFNVIQRQNYLSGQRTGFPALLN